MPNIKFDTMKGREEEKAPETEELILNPTYDLVKPKTVFLADMSKQLERTEEKKVNEYEEALILDVNYNQLDPKVKGIPDLSKLTSRKNLEATTNDDHEELILTPSYTLVQEGIVGGVIMDSKTKRFSDEPEKDLKDLRETTEHTIDYNKAFNATKPETNVVDFNRYDERDIVKDRRKKLAELNKKLVRGDLPVIEEEKFEKYPGEGKENEGKDKKKDILIRNNSLVKKVKASEKVDKKKKGDDVRESNDFKPWGNQQEDEGEGQY